jgi:hypothetical protein
MKLHDMSEEYFQQLVKVLKAGICYIIDQETEDDEERGKLAAALVANVVACFMALPEPVFQHHVNAAMEAAELGWRLVQTN